MLEFKTVTKYYHSYRAVDYLNYTFTSNRIAVYGEESSGKSTVLRLISGVEQCTKGEILFNGEPIDIDKDVFFTFRDGGLLKNKTIRENLLYPLKIRNTENAESIVDSLIEEFDLVSIKDNKPKHISFDERSRIILAKIKLRKTKILLIDNPFENLDNELRAEYFNRFLDIIKDYTGLVVYATDNKQELVNFNEVILLNYGFTKGFGTYSEVFSNPYNMFTFGFFSELKLFNGLLFRDNDDICFTIKDDKIKINDSLASRIVKEYIPSDCVLAVKKSTIDKLNIKLEDISILDLDNNDEIWLFDWNENSLIK